MGAVESLMAAGWLLSAGMVLPDTTVELRRGDRVVVENLSGEVVVEAWDRPALELRVVGGDPHNVAVTRVGQRLQVAPGDRKGRRLEVEAVIRLPAWAGLEIAGRTLDVVVSGMSAGVAVRNVSGDIRVERAVGEVVLSSVEGEIQVHDVRGSVTARSRGDDVTLTTVRGPVDVQSGDGDLRLEDVEAPSVRAETLDGDVYFSGPLAANGSYWFSTHDGDAVLALPPSTGVTVSVSTFDGEFTSEFPVTLQRYGGGGTFGFTLGDGSARLEVQVFDGEIRLVRGR